MTKHVIVTGGVSSSLGKGITAASLGKLLKQRGLKVALQKLDPYLNVDPGTLDPFEHGEVFVTDDGTETDLDIGHYERFLDENLPGWGNATTGQVYQTVLAAERKGDFLGATVQVVPHITNEIKRRIVDLGEKVDVVITEIGGTVGDIEIFPFLEAVRQLKRDVGPGNICFVHVVLVPFLGPSGEHKTKPAQHSVSELRSRGIQPDIIVTRSSKKLPVELRNKIGDVCDVPTDAVISAVDVPNIYEVPLLFHEQGFDATVCDLLKVGRPSDLTQWSEFVASTKRISGTIRVGVVGKYVDLVDAYLSVVEAVKHAGWAVGVKTEIVFIQADQFEALSAGKGRFVDAVIIPGGFGSRGVEGKLAAIRWARETTTPCLGICLGMQLFVIETALNLAGISEANSTEFNPDTPNPVVTLLTGQTGRLRTGATMRRGTYPAKLVEGTRTAAVYNQLLVSERHRHRWEINPEYVPTLEQHGLKVSGRSPDGTLVEFMERTDHPFMVGTQAHPEFLSRPDRPHPLFKALIDAAFTQRGLNTCDEK